MGTLEWSIKKPESEERKMNTNERRKLERFSLTLPASVSVRGRGGPHPPLPVHTRNVSAGGAYFTCKNPLPPRTRVDVRMNMHSRVLPGQGDSRADIMVSGEVVRRDPGGMAVRFGRRFRFMPQNN